METSSERAADAADAYLRFLKEEVLPTLDEVPKAQLELLKTFMASMVLYRDATRLHGELKALIIELRQKCVDAGMLSELETEDT